MEETHLVCPTPRKHFNYKSMDEVPEHLRDLFRYDVGGDRSIEENMGRRLTLAILVLVVFFVLIILGALPLLPESDW